MTNNLGAAVLQLQSTMDGVRHVVDEAAAANSANSDLSQLSDSVNALQGAPPAQLHDMQLSRR